MKIEKPVVESYYTRPVPEIKQTVKKKQAFIRRNLQIGAEEESKDHPAKEESPTEVNAKFEVLRPLDIVQVKPLIISPVETFMPEIVEKQHSKEIISDKVFDPTHEE